MTDRPIHNVAASVRQRLMNRAKASGRPFQEVLQYFAMERFLYRLSKSPHSDRFILKGALMFTVWGAPASRPTRDIDLLAHLNNDLAAIRDYSGAIQNLARCPAIPASASSHISVWACGVLSWHDELGQIAVHIGCPQHTLPRRRHPPHSATRASKFEFPIFPGDRQTFWALLSQIRRS